MFLTPRTAGKAKQLDVGAAQAVYDLRPVAHEAALMVDRGGSTRWKHIRPEQVGTDRDALPQIHRRDGLVADLNEQLIVGGGEDRANTNKDESQDGDGDDGDDAKWTRKAPTLR